MTTVIGLIVFVCNQSRIKSCPEKMSSKTWSTENVLQSVTNSPFIVQIPEQLLELGKKIDVLVDDVYAGFCALDDSRISATSLARHSIRVNLGTATRNAFYFVNKIDEFMWYAQDSERMAKVTADVRQGNFGELDLLLRQLSDCLEQAMEYYAIFKESCNQAKRECETGAEICASKSRETRLRKKKTQIKGGVLAGAGLSGAAAVAAGGTVASVVAGIFTAGIGTVVGLAVTAGVTAVTLGGVGTTAAIATVVVANSCDDLLKKFQQLGRAFGMAADSADQLIETVSDFKYSVDTAHWQVSTIQWSYERRAFENVCSVLNELSTKCSSIYYNTTSATRNKLQKILKEKMNIEVAY